MKFQKGDQLKSVSKSTSSTYDTGVSANLLYMGVIKDATDALTLGRVRVYVPDMGGSEADPTAWLNCVWTSPFIGSTNVLSNTKNSQSYQGTALSYGLWMQAPDTGNLVVVGFLGGDRSQAVILACRPQEYNMWMIPGTANAATWPSQAFDGSTLPWPTERGVKPILPGPPVAEYNKADPSTNELRGPRPRYDPLFYALLQQGLFNDLERGSSTASIMRESPSRVFGLRTPGGFQISVDEGAATTTPAADYSEGTAQAQTTTVDPKAPRYLRLRTPSGAEFVINDNDGYIYGVTALGNSWFELTDSPTAGVQIYSYGDISFRSQANINLHADLNVNIEAGGNIRMNTQRGDIMAQSAQDFSVLTAQDFLQQSVNGSVYMTSGNEFLVSVTSDMGIATGRYFTVDSGSDAGIIVTGNLTLDTTLGIGVSAGTTLNLVSASDMGFATGTNLAVAASGNIGIVASGTILMDGSGNVGVVSGGDLSLKGGSAIGLDAPAILESTYLTMGSVPTPDGPAQPAPPPVPAAVPAPEPGKIVPTALLPDRTVSFTSPPDGMHLDATQLTILSTFPHHEPWYGHPVPRAAGLPGNAGNGAGFTGTAQLSSNAQPVAVPQALDCQPNPSSFPVSQLNPSPAAYALVKSQEGYAINNAGVFALVNGPSGPYIGYGHTLNAIELAYGSITIAAESINIQNGLTPDQADRLLIADMNAIANCVRQQITEQVTQYQFDALCVFALGVGCQTFLSSGVSQLINNCQHNQVPNVTQQYIMGNGVNQDGLAQRRAAEAQLFATTPPMAQRILPIPPMMGAAPGCCQEINAGTPGADVRLGQHFTLSQLTASNTARRLGINNTPTDPVVIQNLCNLCTNALDPIADQYSNVVVTSGYRGPDLNRNVGGAGNSQHCTGQAADLQFPGMNLSQVFSWIQTNISFDQVIMEHDSSTTWIHVSYASSTANRRIAATLTKGSNNYQVVNSMGTGQQIVS